MREIRKGRLCSAFLSIYFFSVLIAVNLLAQERAQTSGSSLQILKLKWEKQMRLPGDFDPSGGSTGTINDPTRSSSGGGSGASRAGAADQGLGPPAPPSRVSFVYVYSMKVKNIGPKPIEAVAWDYLFLDPTSHAEVARHQFLSFEKVQPDKTATFEVQQRTPPTRKPKTEEKGSDKQAKLEEQAIIQCVLYADESTWRNSNTPESVCDLLKKGKSNLTRGRRGSLN
jgi:hypothetical protein